MNKLTIVCIIAFALACGSKKKVTETASTPAAVTIESEAVRVRPSYIGGVAAIIKASCAPCHFPNEGGNKSPLDNIKTVKVSIDVILDRVKRAKDARGFMPFMNKKPALTPEEIKLLEDWKKTGMGD